MKSLRSLQVLDGNRRRSVTRISVSNPNRAPQSPEAPVVAAACRPLRAAVGATPNMSTSQGPTPLLPRAAYRARSAGFYRHLQT